MYTELLRTVGLSLNEAKIYEALLQSGDSSVQEIALKASVHRRNTYDSLAKLMEKGLAMETFAQGEKRFTAAHPRQIVTLLKEKETRITEALPQMEATFESRQEDEEALMYKGVEGVKNYLRDILKTKETVYFIGAKAFWLDPRLQHFLPHFQRERKKLGIKFKHIFDHNVKEEKPGILPLVEGTYKFLPKNYASQTAVDIFGPYVVTFIGVRPGELPKEPVLFVLKNRTLADGYRTFFQFMWDHCE